MRRRDFWRRFQPFKALHADPDSEVCQDPPDPAGSSSHSDRLLHMRLTEGLARLGWDKRQVVLLYYLGGFSLAEIADLRGESLSAAKSRLSRARSELRTVLDNPMDLSVESRPSTRDWNHDVEEHLIVAQDRGSQ